MCGGNRVSLRLMNALKRVVYMQRVKRCMYEGKVLVVVIGRKGLNEVERWQFQNVAFILAK